MSDLKLNRSDVMKKIMAVRNNALVITGLGSPVWDLQLLTIDRTTSIVGVEWAAPYLWDWVAHLLNQKKKSG